MATPDGTVAVVRMALDGDALTTAELARITERMTLAVNTLFGSEPQIVRVCVIGQLPATAETGISLVVDRAISPAWGAVPSDEIVRLAQSYYVKPNLLR